MRKLNIVATVITVLGLLLTVVLVSAFKNNQEIVVDTGYVIAYGSYISGPYRITIKNGIIFVNDIQYQPRKEQKRPVLNERDIPEHIKTEHDLFVLIGRKYAEWALKFGIDNALQRLDAFLKTQAIIETYRIRPEDESVQIKFRTSEYPEVILLYSFRAQRPAPAELKKQEKRYQRESLNSLIEILQQKGMFTFGQGYETFMPYPGSEQSISAINAILKSPMSDSEKEALLKKLKIMDILLKDVLENQVSWPK